MRTHSWFFAVVVTLFVLATGPEVVAEDYFPPNSLAEKEEDHARHEDYYRKVFTAFDEPSLTTLIKEEKVADKRIFRFTWLRTFHRPVCVVLETADKKSQLKLKVLDGKGAMSKSSASWSRRSRWS